MRAWRWPVAITLAALAHAAIFVGIANPMDGGHARAAGSGGLLIGLAPAGGRAGNAAQTQQADTVEPTEPEPETAPRSEPESEPRPDHPPKPDPRIIERDPRAETPETAIPEPEPKPETKPEPKPEPKPIPESKAPEPDSVTDQITTTPKAHRTTQAGSNARAGSGGGQAAGVTDGRSGGGDPGVRADYFARLKAHLNRYKEYPRRARQRRAEGVVRIAFTLHADGHIADARIAQGSGAPLLDRAALAMLQHARPLPPFPPQLGHEPITLTVPVAFDLR